LAFGVSRCCLALDRPFLRDVAAALQGRELGDGLVARTCVEVQRRYLRLPICRAARGIAAGGEMLWRTSLRRH